MEESRTLLPPTTLLSKAIRAGITLDGPQVREQYFRIVYKYDEAKIAGCCALGAALLAVCNVVPQPTFADKAEFIFPDGQSFVTARDAADHVWPPLKLNVPCPGFTEDDDAPCVERSNQTSIVIHLNDEHRWTREQIADWLEMQGL